MSAKTVRNANPKTVETKAKNITSDKSEGESTIKVDINEAHKLLGYVGLKSLRETAKMYGWDIVRELKVCAGCVDAKAKAKPVAKFTVQKAGHPGERLFIDTSGPYAKSVIGNKYWMVIVDDFSPMKWSFFRKQKSDISKVLSGFLDQLEGFQYNTKFLRCDDAGENTKQLADVCKKRGITIEHTAPHTPQHNGVVERAFVTLRQRAMAMMFTAKFTDEYQGLLWAEAVNTATVLTNQAINSVNKDCPNDLFYGTILPKLRHPYKHLKEFWRIGHVTTRTDLKKLDKKTVKCVFLGYSMNHVSGTYRMYNPETNSIINLRDIKWAAWHGSNNPLLSLEKLFSQKPAELPVEPNEHKKAAEDDKDDLDGPSAEVVTNNSSLDDDSDDDIPTQEEGRKEPPNKLSILNPAPTSAPSTQPSNFGRKTYTPNTPNPNLTSWKDVNTRLVKVAKVARAMKKLETSYNTPD